MLKYQASQKLFILFILFSKPKKLFAIAAMLPSLSLIMCTLYEILIGFGIQ